MAFQYAGRFVSAIVTQPAGRPVPFQNVTVYLKGTTTLASLYTDKTKATAAANPAVTDSNGNLTIFAAPGDYDLYLNGAIITVTVDPDPSDLALLGDNLVTIANSGTAITLDLSLGSVFDISLNTPIVAISFANVTKLVGDTVKVKLRQDASGWRYVTWPTAVQWPNGAVPALTQTPAGVDVFTLVTTDLGATFQASGGVSSFPGVDPITIPTCIGAWRADHQPYALGAATIGAGSTLALPEKNALGTALGPSLTAPNAAATLTDGFGRRLLTPDNNGGRRMLQNQAGGGLQAGLVLPVSGFTVILAYQQLDTANAIGGVWKVNTPVGNWEFYTVASGSPIVFSAAGSSVFASLAANQFVGEHVIAFVWDGTAGKVWYADNADLYGNTRIPWGIATPSSGPANWTSTQNGTTTLVSYSDTSPYFSKVNVAAWYCFAGALDFSSASSPGTLAARYVGAMAGVTV